MRDWLLTYLLPNFRALCFRARCCIHIGSRPFWLLVALLDIASLSFLLLAFSFAFLFPLVL